MTRPEAHVLLGYLKRYRTEHITCERKYDVASEMIAEVMEMLNQQGGLLDKHGCDINVQGTVTKRLGDMTEPQLAEFIVKTVQESIARNAIHPNF